MPEFKSINRKQNSDSSIKRVNASKCAGLHICVCVCVCLCDCFLALVLNQSRPSSSWCVSRPQLLDRVIFSSRTQKHINKHMLKWTQSSEQIYTRLRFQHLQDPTPLKPKCAQNNWICAERPDLQGKVRKKWRKRILNAVGENMREWEEGEMVDLIDCPHVQPRYSMCNQSWLHVSDILSWLPKYTQDSFCYDSWVEQQICR